MFNVTVADGKLDLGFSTKVNASSLTGLQILSATYTEPPAPTQPPAQPTSTTVNDNTIGSSTGQFAYSGNWKYLSDSSRKYQNDDHYSNSAGATATIKFSGTGITLYGAKAAHHGIAAVSIDGGAETNVDYYAQNREDQVAVYTSPTLNSGNHTLKIRVTGNKRSAANDSVVTVDKVIYQTSASTGNDQTGAYNNKILIDTHNAAFYVRDRKSTHIVNSAIQRCIEVRRGTGTPMSVPDNVVSQYDAGTEGYCYYEQEPGLNFVREEGNPYVWLVQAGGTKRHVGAFCVSDPYATSLKKFRVFVVPAGETAGHRNVGDYFGTPSNCAQLPG